MLRHERLPSPAVSSPKRYLYVLLAVVVASLRSDVIVAQSSSVSAPLRAVKDKIVERTTTNYIIIIDAGSSGSRVHVHPFIRKEPMPKIDPSKTLKITPGLSSYEHNPKEGGDSLIKLLDFAKENIPQEFWASTPIHLKATAGLRSIPLAAAEQVLVECRKVIRLYPFKFQDEWALIISGSQEGIFGWVSANYLEGFLGIPGKRTVGVIEMGGASMQITFVPDIVPPEVKNRVTPVTIGSQTYPVYTHSYLNYGLDAVQRLFHTTHHQHVTESGHPCYPKSYKHPQHTWSGTGNHEQCSTMMDGLFKKENCSVPQAMCTWNGIAQPPISTEKFYAIENYFYTSSFFGVHEHDNPWEHLEKKGKEYCSTHWDSISEQWAKESKDDLAKYCFSSIYLTKVLKRGFGLTSPNKHAHIRSKINGAKIDWALGAVLYELMLEAHHPIAPTTTASDDEEEGESISEESEMKPPSVPEVQASRSGIEDAKPLAPATPAVAPVDSVTDHSAHSAPLADEPKPTVAVVAAPPAAPPVAVTEVAPSVATPPAPSVPIHAPETPAHLKNPVTVPSTVAEPIDFLEEERVKRVAEERRAGGTGSMHTLIDSFPATAPETATAVEVTGTAPDLFENELFLAAAGIMLSGVLLYAYVAAKKRNPFFILNYLGQRQASRRRPDIFLDELKFSV